MDTNSQHDNNFSLASQNHNVLTQNTKPFVNERHTSSAHLSTRKVRKPTSSSIESFKTGGGVTRQSGTILLYNI